MTSVRHVVLLLAIVAGGRGAWAQGESGGIVLEHPASARALALGDAMVAVRDADASLFTNPALLDATHGARATVSGQRYIANSSLAAVSGAAGCFGGTVALGMRGLNYGSVAEYVPDTVNFGGQRGVATGRDVSASEFAITAGYAHAAGRIHVGAAIGYVQEQVAGASGGAATADLGAAADLPRGVTLGVAVQQLGGTLRLGRTPSQLPRLVRAGASAPLKWGSLGALLTAEALYRPSGDVEPKAGAELGWRTANGVTLTARGGVRGGTRDDVLSRYTYGAGLAAAHVAMDYAYQAMGPLGGGAHRIGVRFQR